MNRGFVALFVTALATSGVITYVHYDQKRELRRMRQGVYLDAEREQFRRQVLAQQSNSETEPVAADPQPSKATS